MRIALKFLQILLPILGFWGALELSYQQFLTGIACPIVLVPVCYVITALFLLILLGALLQNRFKKLQYFYWGALGIGLVISSLATFSNLSGYAVCPSTSTGWPMCYLALALFVMITLLSIIDILKLKP